MQIKQMPSFHHKRPHKPTRLKAPIFLHIKDPSTRGGEKRGRGKNFPTRKKRRSSLGRKMLIITIPASQLAIMWACNSAKRENTQEEVKKTHNIKVTPSDPYAMLMKTTMMRKSPETNFLMEKMPKMQKSGRKEQSREDTMPLYKDDGYQEQPPNATNSQPAAWQGSLPTTSPNIRYNRPS
jgi:hypothetical protein